MSQSLRADYGYRTVEADGSSRSDESRAAARARRSSPGAWREDLGPVLGSERWNLPGMGESGPGCGEWVPEAVCGSCGGLELTSHSCGRRTCPECWGVWAKEGAVRATVRVQAFRYTQPPDWRRQAAHAVVSPPEGEVTTVGEFFEARKKAAAVAKRKGWRGFSIIPHPYRATDKGKARYEAEVPRDEEGNAVYGFWVWARSDLEVGEWREVTYWSPHYHVLGVTGADMEPAVESDEWVYSFVRSVESFEGIRDMGSHGDVYGAFRYLLSHAGWPAGSTKQIVTWYGCLSNSVFVENAREEWQYPKPSEGVLSALERAVEEVAGPMSDEGEGEGDALEEGDEGACPVEGCEGRLIHVFDVDAYLRQTNPPPEVVKRMRTARDWRLGRVEPPPGLKHPRSERAAREAFEALVS